MIAFRLFLRNYSPQIGLQRDIFYFYFYFTVISCSKLYLCYNLIIVPYPVGQLEQLWDYDALYNSPHLPCLSHLLSSLSLLYVYADDVSKRSSPHPAARSPRSCQE